MAIFDTKQFHNFRLEPCARRQLNFEIKVNNFFRLHDAAFYCSRLHDIMIVEIRGTVSLKFKYFSIRGHGGILIRRIIWISNGISTMSWLNAIKTKIISLECTDRDLELLFSLCDQDLLGM